jgi:DNA modification methylase
MTTHRVHVQSCLKIIEPDSSIDLIVTSPPYNVGIQYQKYNDQMIYLEYRKFLESAWNECFRVLKPGGHLCIVVGDAVNTKDSDKRSRILSTHSIIQQQLMDSGKWSIVGEIVWDKQNNVNAAGGGSLLGSYPFPPNPWIRTIYEHILIFRKIGATVHRILTIEEKEASKLTIEEWKEWVTGIWKTPGVQRGLAQFAAFPEEIPRRLIRMYSFVGDTVLDPFYGTGTTGKVAKALGRSSIGYELDGELKRFWMSEELE